MKLATANIHVGINEADPTFGSVTPPIYLSSTYIFPSALEAARRFKGKSFGMIYSRLTNPTVLALEKRLANLEGGEKALTTASGMAAIALTFFHLLKEGDEVIAHRVVYGGTYELLSRIIPRYGIGVKFVDFNKEEEIKKNLNKNTKILFFESPTNPLLEIIDIKKIVLLAKKHHILTVFDNTFAPPPCQFPLRLGIDLVVYSLTKYISGHSDTLGGAIIGRSKIVQEMYSKSYIFLGPTLSPFAAYLILRGMTTLEVRLNKQAASALKIAQFLENHPKVKRVYYPGLASYSNYKLAIKQMNNFGGVLSFEIKGGCQAGKRLVDSVKLIHLAVSLGAVESLIEHPSSMTHSEMSVAERKKSGLKDGLIRLSVGLEDVYDLIDDLKQALEKV